MILVLMAIAACGGDDSDGAAPDDTGSDTSVDEPAGDVAEPDTTESPDPGEATFGGTDACSLLDEDFLDDTLDGSTNNFGEPFDFQAPSSPAPSATCSWTDTSGLSVQLTVEPTAESETQDHSGRAYNIDVEPTVEPQDGPGTDAVLLVDTAFDDLGSDGFPYGYFFVEGDDAVFIETVGLDVGAEALRAFADEADRRLLAG